MEIEGKIVKLSKFTKASLEESWNWIIGNVIDTFYWSSFAVNNHLYSDILRNFFKVSAWISSLNKPCNFYSCDLRRILKRFLLLKHSQLVIFWCRFLGPLQYGWRRLEGTARPFNNSWKWNNLFFLHQRKMLPSSPLPHYELRPWF